MTKRLVEMEWVIWDGHREVFAVEGLAKNTPGNLSAKRAVKVASLDDLDIDDLDEGEVGEDGVSPDEADEVMQLIAAAPKLLAAVVIAYEACNLYRGKSPAIDEALEHLKAAHEAATGSPS